MAVRNETITYFSPIVLTRMGFILIFQSPGTPGSDLTTQTPASELFENQENTEPQHKLKEILLIVSKDSQNVDEYGNDEKPCTERADLSDIPNILNQSITSQSDLDVPSPVGIFSSDKLQRDETNNDLSSQLLQNLAIDSIASEESVTTMNESEAIENALQDLIQTIPVVQKFQKVLFNKIFFVSFLTKYLLMKYLFHDYYRIEI